MKINYSIKTSEEISDREWLEFKNNNPNYEYDRFFWETWDKPQKVKFNPQSYNFMIFDISNTKLEENDK